MKISYHHRVAVEKQSLVLAKKARQYTAMITKGVKDYAYTAPEASLFIASDTTYQRDLEEKLSPFTGVNHVILVGIGGSSLGTEAAYAALSEASTKKLTVIDSVTPESIMELEKGIAGVEDVRELVLVVVSKSGATTETMLNAAKVMDVCEKKYGNMIYSQTIFIGDPGTPFMKIGQKSKVLCLSIPKIIGGRYSVFTAVGMVPLFLLGIDMKAFRKGAAAAFTKKSLKQVEESATVLALHALGGVHTVNFFTFNKRLALCGYWYRQLLAESIGKTMTNAGTPFEHQLLPIVSTSVDLHSMAQLYLGGYKNLYTHFVYYKEVLPYHVRAKHWLVDHMPILQKTTFAKISGAITKGVLRAYDDQKLPYRVTELESLSAYEVGYLMVTLMAETMYLGHLLDVNPFDQPNVEQYKKHVRSALGSK